MKEAAPLTGDPDHDWAVVMVAHHKVCWALKPSFMYYCSVHVLWLKPQACAHLKFH